MDSLDKQIMRAFFRLQEARRQRLRLERLWHPDHFEWRKQGAPPTQSWSTLIMLEELEAIGEGPAAFDHWQEVEEKAKAQLEELAQEHVLWPYFDSLKGFGPYIAGCFIAAAGDIERAPTVSGFWRGMGLDLVDGQAPRRVRGSKDERRIPCLPHVSLVGEQLRQQMLRSGGRLYTLYASFREHYDSKYPQRPKIYNFKAALRATQKVLYACLWREWRLARRLPAPEPYAFAILRHNGDGGPIRIGDLLDKPLGEPEPAGTRRR